MSEAVFKVGETVYLNSGGDLMTIVPINQDSVTREWFVKGSVKSRAFPAVALKRSDGTPQSVTLNFGRKLPGDNSE
jgi:uncharacterized protein YodC (DUF2158 family)